MEILLETAYIVSSFVSLYFVYLGYNEMEPTTEHIVDTCMFFLLSFVPVINTGIAILGYYYFIKLKES